MNPNYQEYITRIFLNNSEALEKIKELKESIKKYQLTKEEALRTGGAEGDKAWKEADKAIKRAEAEMRKYQITSQSINEVLRNLDKAAPKEIERTIKAINASLRDGSVERGTKEWESLQEQLARCKNELKEIKEESSAASLINPFSSLWDSLNKNWGAITQVKDALGGIVESVQQYTDAYVQSEEQMANVRKYTGQTSEEIHAMNEEFNKIDTRTSIEQLNELAGAAGRLGITSHNEIMDFVDAADKINTALGDDLGDGAVDQIGKLAMAFGENEKMGLRGAMLATGSAINELAQKSSSNAGYLVDFTARLSGVGKQAGMTQAQIMGIGSVMDENMQRTEVASTSIQQLITRMVSDPAKFAKLAGQDVKEFTELVKNDMNGALLTFFKAMKDKGGFSDLAPMFAQMGLNGTEAIQVLSVVADKIERVKQNQDVATNAYKDGSSVISEFNTQNDTEAAKLEKIQKQISTLKAELGQQLLPIVKTSLSVTKAFLSILGTIITFMAQHIVTVGVLTGAITTLVVIQTKDIILKKAQIALSAVQKFWNEVLAVSFKKLWKIMAAHPYGAIVVAVMAVIAVVADLTRKIDRNAAAAKALNKIRDEAKVKAEEERQKIEALRAAAQNEKLSLDDRKKAIDKLNEIIPDYNAQLDATSGKYRENKKALDDYIKSLEKKYELEGAKDMLKDIGKKLAELNVAHDKAVQAAHDAAELRRQTTENNRKAGVFRLSTRDETNFLNGNVDTAMKRIKDINQELKDKLAERNAILRTYGDDLQREAARGDDDSGNGSGGNSGGGGDSGNEGNNSGGGGGKSGETTEEKMRKELDAAKKQSERLLTIEADIYARGLENASTYNENRYNITKNGIEARAAIYKKYGKQEAEDAQDLSLEQRKAETERWKQATDISIKELEKKHQMEKAQLKANFYDQTSELYGDQEKLNEALFQSDMDYLEKKAQKYPETSDEYAAIRAEIDQKNADHQLELQQKFYDAYHKLLTDAGITDLDALEQQHEKELSELKEALDKKLITQEEYEKASQNVNAQYAMKKAAATMPADRKKSASDAIDMAKKNVGASDVQYDNSGNDMGITAFAGIFAIVEQRQKVNEELKRLYEQNAIDQQTYEDAKRQNSQDTFDKTVAAAQAAFSGINNIMSAASAYAQACSQLETAKIQADYDKQIAAAGKNSKKKEKLEKERDEKLRKAKTQANKKAMTIEIAQAVASTALAAINAYASASKVSAWLGPVAAAMATAAGMMQIATIKKQHQAEEAGYYEGGFTGGSSYRKKAGVVHEGEFVANHQAVNNPQLLPALQLIDQAQKSNTVGSLTASDVTAAMGGQPVVNVAAPVVQVQTDNAELNAAINDVTAVVDNLNAILAKGIRAQVGIDGPDGFDSQYRKYLRLKERGR